MSEIVLWIHADALSPYNPAFTRYPGAPAIYVWDDALLHEWQISLKRITFIYECLLELPVTIHRGNVPERVVAFARGQGAKQVVTVESVSPRFGKIASEIETMFPVVILQPEPFVPYDGHLDLKRFSRYWRVAQRYVFKDGDVADNGKDTDG